MSVGRSSVGENASQNHGLRVIKGRFAISKVYTGFSNGREVKTPKPLRPVAIPLYEAMTRKLLSTPSRKRPQHHYR